MTSDEKRVCQKCNSENTFDSRFCKNCNSALDDKSTLIVDPRIGLDKAFYKGENIEFDLAHTNFVANRYKILEEVGSGGMGVVYRAFDEKLERHIALKTLKFEESDGVKLDILRKQLVFEAKAVAKLKHSNIISVYDVGSKDLMTFVAMEFIEGETLSSLIDRKGRQEVSFVIDLISQVCDAVSHAHEEGIIHRDLKPGNIMLENGKEVKITDFGIAKFIQDKNKKDDIGYVIGTPSYMAPERFDGIQDDLRSDIYAIGVIMYELITGLKPFRDKCYPGVIYKIKNERYKPIREIIFDIPDFIEEIVSKALNKNPKERHQSAEEFKTELLRSIKGKNKSFGEETFSVFNVPFHRNRNFTGRLGILSRIALELSKEKVLAIHGMGGIGKSQTVSEYVYRHADEYAIIWWINSEDATTLISKYVSLAEPLNLPFKGMKELDVINIVKGKLEQIDNWLLIFDNAENPRDIRDYFPKTDNGHILITSRSPKWGEIALTLSLDEMAPDESVAFLLKRTNEKDKNAAEELAVKLGYLPLALEQAGSYIESSGMRISDYIALHKKYLSKLMDKGKPTDYPETVSTTWGISFERIKVKSKAAIELMNLFAFFAPEDIPIPVLEKGTEYLPDGLKEIITDPFEFGDAITVLRNYSIVRRFGKSLSIHRLMQTVIRDKLNEEEKKFWSENAFHIIDNAFVFDNKDLKTWAECAQLLPHSNAVVQNVLDSKADLNIICDLLNRMGCFLNNSGQFMKAKRLVSQALEIEEKIHGSSHFKIADIVNNLGTIHGEIGELEIAENYHRKAFEIDEKIYGTSHPIVARDFNNLGNILGKRGELEEARLFLEKALKIDENYYDELHPNIGIRLNNLGLIFWNQGKHSKAKMYFERSLNIFESVYGSDHPNVAFTLNNLSLIHKELGEFENAKGCLEKSLRIEEKTFGSDHPNVAIVWNNLGIIHRELGELEDAKMHFERALSIVESIYNEGHPQIAEVLYNLGHLYRKSGNLEKAKENLEKSLEIRQKILGSDHPKTIKVNQDLQS